MFQGLWVRAATDELADLWGQADSALRQAITAASNSIDQLLRIDPQNQGEARDAGERVMFILPLGVQFDILPAALLVRVLHVWDCRPRP